MKITETIKELRQALKRIKVLEDALDDAEREVEGAWCAVRDIHSLKVNPNQSRAVRQLGFTYAGPIEEAL